MRPLWALLAPVVAFSGACFVDLTGEPGGAAPYETTSVFMAGGWHQGGAPAAGGGGSGGGGGSTTSGIGGGTCGDATPTPGEECDDGNAIDGDGCSADCQAEMHDTCPTNTTGFAFVAGLRQPLVVEGDTVTGADELTLGDEGSCQSDAPEQWIAVRMLETGAVEARLRATEGFGNEQENAILHVRRGCGGMPDYERELVCVRTGDGMNLDSTESRMFVRAGETIYYAVDGRTNGDDGKYELTIEMLSICGDSIVGPLEQCESGADCAGCMLKTFDCDGALGSGLFDDSSGHCFVAVETTPVNFWAARRACVEAGGDLFSLDANDGAQPASLGEVWVGLVDLQQGDGISEFRWLGNNMVGPLSVPADEDPNKLRCAVRHSSLILDDKLCDQSRGYICELHLGNP